MVLLLHAFQNFPVRVFTELPLIQVGYLGVDLFFILSGYIMCHVYLRHMGELRPASVRVFLWHRLIRLAPVHFVILGALVAMIALASQAGIRLNEAAAWSFADLPWHFLMLHAWGTVSIAGWNAPSWSISAELFAYILFPALALALTRLSRPAAFVLGIAAFAATVAAFAAFGWKLKLAWIGAPALARVAGEFILGACLYRALHAGPSMTLSGRRADALALCGLAGFAAAAMLRAHEFVLVALLGVLLAGVAGEGPLVRRTFAARPLVWLGEVSYSVYLVHFPLLAALRKLAEAAGQAKWGPALNIAALIAAIAAVVAVSALLYYAVERPVRSRLRNALGVMETARPSGRRALEPVSGEHRA